MPGFVSIEEAELLRQRASVQAFRQRHEAEYSRLVAAAKAFKLAHQELEEAKTAARALPINIPTVDLLDEVEREVRRELQQASAAPTTAQIEQTAGAGKKSKAA